ncbi:MAG: hypothetical protein ACXW1W_10915 [Methylococcaceae bacterium]
MNDTLKTIFKNWQSIAPLVSVPYTEAEYQKRIALLNDLIDEVGENEDHPLASILDIVGVAVSNYEQAHYPAPTSTPQNILTYFNGGTSTETIQFTGNRQSGRSFGNFARQTPIECPANSDTRPTLRCFC